MDKKNKNSDPFWSENISILFDKDRLIEFFPTKDMSITEQLNSVVRFSFYLGFLLGIYYKQTKFIFIPIFMISLSLFVYRYSTDTIENLENLKDSEQECTKPTKGNPFMNILPTDYTENPERGPACNPNDPKVAKEVKDAFEIGMYKDVNDPFDNEEGDRNFYTQPVTTIPDDEEAFRNWIVNGVQNCKEDGDCEPYYDMKDSEPIEYDDPVEREEARLRSAHTSTKSPRVYDFY